MWAKERLEHEEIVARALAVALIRDGLVLNSVDARWMEAKEKVEFKGYPYVGFCPVIGLTDINGRSCIFTR